MAPFAIITIFSKCQKAHISSVANCGVKELPNLLNTGVEEILRANRTGKSPAQFRWMRLDGSPDLQIMCLFWRDSPWSWRSFSRLSQAISQLCGRSVGKPQGFSASKWPQVSALTLGTPEKSKGDCKIRHPLEHYEARREMAQLLPWPTGIHLSDRLESIRTHEYWRYPTRAG